jgi:DNA-binding XRE family transcriptional regulator
MNRMLSAQQIRAGRGLLGWSRRDLAIVAGISQGTIKAIEKGTTDARLSTLRKLAQTFTAHGVEFVATGTWTGAVIKTRAEVGQTSSSRIPRRSDSIASAENAEATEEDPHINEIAETGDEVSASWRGLQWLGPLVRAARARKV